MSRPTVVTVLPMMQEHHPCPSQHEPWRQDIHDRLQQPTSPSSLHRHHQQPLSPAAHLENSVHNKPHLNQPHQSYNNRGIKSSKSGSNRTTRSLRKSSTSSYSTSKTGQNHSSSSLLESKFFDLGYMIQKHAAIVLFIGFMALFTSSVFLKSATIETRVEKLWVEGMSILVFVYTLSYPAWFVFVINRNLPLSLNFSLCPFPVSCNECEERSSPVC